MSEGEIWCIVCVKIYTHYADVWIIIRCLPDKYHNHFTCSCSVFVQWNTQNSMIYCQLKYEIELSIDHLLNLVIRLNIGIDNLRLFYRFFHHSE